MYFLLSIVILALSALILLLPVFLILRFAYFRQWKKTGICFLLALYFSGIYSVTGLPTVLFTAFEPSFYLLPIVGILDDIRNSILNIILFLPLGFLVSIFCGRFRSMKAALLLGLSCSLFIELAQMFTYRLSDINDLLTNALGAVLGYQMARPLFPRIKPSCISGKDLGLTVAAAIAVMYFLQPLLSSQLWLLIP